MTCTHLKDISRVCEENGLKIGRTDLVRFVCQECAEQEVCPANSIEIDDPEVRLVNAAVLTRSMNLHVNTAIAAD